MFEGRALSELTYAEFEGFLKEANEEGTRLDYKEQWNPAAAARIVSSFANTAGGFLVVGVEEKRDRKDPKIKLKIPDPVNVTGLKPKDWESSASDAVRSRTRPGLVPEAKALEIPNHPDGYVVLLVRVEESLEAPHEVHATSTPETPEGELTDGILDQLAKFERAKTTERTRRGKLQKARRGKVVAGPRPNFGFKYNASRDNYVVDEEQMRIIKRIFREVGVRDEPCTPSRRHSTERGAVPVGEAVLESQVHPRPHQRQRVPAHSFKEVAALVEPRVAAQLDPSESYGVW